MCPFFKEKGLTLHRVAVDWSITISTDFEPSLKRFQHYLEGLSPYHPDLELFRDNTADRKMGRSTKNQYNYAMKAYHAILGDPIE